MTNAHATFCILPHLLMISSRVELLNESAASLVSVSVLSNLGGCQNWVCSPFQEAPVTKECAQTAPLGQTAYCSLHPGAMGAEERPPRVLGLMSRLSFKMGRAGFSLLVLHLNKLSFQQRDRDSSDTSLEDLANSFSLPPPPSGGRGSREN